MLEDIKNIVQSVYPEAELKSFGSYPLGMSIFQSDLDASIDDIASVEAVRDDPDSHSTRRDGSLRKPIAMSVLKPLIDKLRDKPWTRRCTIVRSARVPLIKLEHRCGIVVDLSADSSSSNGARVVQSLLDRAGPALMDLSAFLKVYLQQQGLNEPFTGGLGSYGLYLLLTQHIEEHAQTIPKPALGDLLKSFALYYGQSQNFNENTVVRVEGADPYNLGKVANADKLCGVFMKLYKSLQREDAVRVNGTHRPYLADVLNKTALRFERNEARRKCKAFLRTATAREPKFIDPLDKYLSHVEKADRSSLALGMAAMSSLQSAPSSATGGGVKGNVSSGGGSVSLGNAYIARSSASFSVGAGGAGKISANKSDRASVGATVNSVSQHQLRREYSTQCIRNDPFGPIQPQHKVILRTPSNNVLKYGYGVFRRAQKLWR